MKKKKIKKKIRWKKVGILLVFILVLGVLVYRYQELHITNIYVTGNHYLKENDIIKKAGLLDYPKILEVRCEDIEHKLLTEPLINQVKVRRSLLGKVYIDIDENTFLYRDNANNVMLSNGKMIENVDMTGIPTLINEVVDVEDKFIRKLVLIDKDILIRISEIEYKPSELDKERFLFYMNDGNYVYITLSKIELINAYNEIYPTLEGKKGILYLDSGNHFEIKK